MHPTRIVVMVSPGKRPIATLHHGGTQIGEIVILSPYRIIVKAKGGRKDCFSSIEACARFCGIPTSDNIQIEWRAHATPLLAD